MPWWLADPNLQAQKPPLPVMRGREPQMPPSKQEPLEETFVPEPRAETFAPKPLEEKNAAPESRLSGLRNIFRISEAAPPPPHPEPIAPISAPPAEMGEEVYVAWQPAPPVHPVHAVPEPQPLAPAEPLIGYRGEAFVPFPEPESESGASTPVDSPTPQVTAVPEFLPPRKSRWDSDNKRMERRETEDGIAVLPSWRGQYRRKD